jgi:hypothetical protein
MRVLLLFLIAPLCWAQSPDADTLQTSDIAQTVLPEAWLKGTFWEFVHSEERADTLRTAVFWSDLGTAVTLTGPGPLQVRVLAFYPERLPVISALTRTPPPMECPTEEPPFAACRSFPHPDTE